MNSYDNVAGWGCCCDYFGVGAKSPIFGSFPSGCDIRMCGYRGKFSLRDFRRLVSGTGARGIYAAIVAGVLGAASALVLFGLPAQAQTPTPPPVELPWVTRTPTAMEAYICPVEPPAWWGTATPSAFWWLFCGHCAADWPRPHWDLPRPATWTPYPLPTVAITGTPFMTTTPTGTPLGTPSPSPSPSPPPIATPTAHATPVPTYTGPTSFTMGYQWFSDGWILHRVAPGVKYPDYNNQYVFSRLFEPCGVITRTGVTLGLYHVGNGEGVGSATFDLQLDRIRDSPWGYPIPRGIMYYRPISFTFTAVPSCSGNHFPDYRELEVRWSDWDYRNFDNSWSIVDPITVTRMTVIARSQKSSPHIVFRWSGHFAEIQRDYTTEGGCNIDLVVVVDVCGGVSAGVPVPSPTPVVTPTSTPAITSTPTPTTTPPYTGTSLCENPYLEGTPTEIITPPSYGGIQCFNFRGTGLMQLPIIGGWEVPDIRICFAEMFLGQVSIFGVTVNLDTIAGILAGILVFRLLSEV